MTRYVPVRIGPKAWTSAAVDDRDYARLARHTWSLHSRGYATRHTTSYRPGMRNKDRHILMHREILGLGPRTPKVDHRNLNKLDNRRLNLRIATDSQNKANVKPTTGRSSRYKGVSYDSTRASWLARLEVNGKQRNLGRFASERDAALAYNAAALDAWGEFARLNEMN